MEASISYFARPHSVLIKEKILCLKPKGIILSGGPNSVTESFTPRVPKCVFDMEVPILGICYGMQTLAEQMGGHVISADKKEFGHTVLNILSDSILFKEIDKKINVWMSHGDQVQDLPDEFNLVASTSTAPIAAILNLMSLKSLSFVNVIIGEWRILIAFCV